MALADWEPSVEQVGGLLRERTRANGAEQGTFTAATRPTAAQVDDMIDQAAATVSRYVGPDIDPSLWDDARNVVAERAAMLVELSYFATEVAHGDSPFPQIKALYDEDLRSLQASATSSGGEEPSDANLHPTGGFPSPLGPPSRFVPDCLGPPWPGGWSGWPGYWQLPAEYLPW